MWGLRAKTYILHHPQVSRLGIEDLLKSIRLQVLQVLSAPLQLRFFKLQFWATCTDISVIVMFLDSHDWPSWRPMPLPDEGDSRFCSTLLVMSLVFGLFLFTEFGSSFVSAAPFCRSFFSAANWKVDESATNTFDGKHVRSWINKWYF